MRKTFLFLLLYWAFPSNAQKLQQLKWKGDSLADSNHPKEAAVIYDQCIDIVLSDKQAINDNDWFAILLAAINANKPNAGKYSSLAYGTRAEKMTDEIALLKNMGVKYILSFSSWGYSTPTIGGSPYTCPIDETKTFLVWGINDDVFMQAFNTCNTYKPFKLNDKQLYAILKDHTKEMVNETVTPALMKYGQLLSKYNFVFYTATESFTKGPVDIAAFRDVKGNISSDELKYISQEKIDRANKIYLSNIQTYFSKFFLLICADEIKYINFINSGAERAKVGKFE
ncbi:MAG: hypothetical protein JWR50_2064 [Mucilaginibacter sp.]|nr:hypothetical protein [Mucilaginibacter sp.]